MDDLVSPADDKAVLHKFVNEANGQKG